MQYRQHARWIGHLALVVFTAPGASSCTNADAGAEPTSTLTTSVRPIAVRTVVVKVDDLRETADYLGTVRPHREVKVSARVAGVLGEHEAAEGDEVSVDSRLVRLASPEMDARLRGSAANLRRLRTQRAQACRVYDVDRGLVARGALTSARLDASRTGCESATHALSGARSKHGELELNAGYADVTSPVSGEVLAWLMEPGELATPGRPLAIVGTGAREIGIRLTDRDLLKGVGVGHLAEFEVPGRRTYATQVVRVAPRATGIGRHIEVRLAMPQDAPALPPGTAVDVAIVLREAKRAAVVPRRSILHAPDGDAFIFVADHGVVSQRPVKLGVAQEDWIEVTPLEPGAQVVTSNIGMLSDDAIVIAVPETESR
jgi:RND family efflux transporter MFP subunit